MSQRRARFMECSDCPVEQLAAQIDDLTREPTPTYSDVMRACGAGAVRLGVDPTPWAGGATRAAGPVACGALGASC